MGVCLLFFWTNTRTKCCSEPSPQRCLLVVLLLAEAGVLVEVAAVVVAEEVAVEVAAAEAEGEGEEEGEEEDEVPQSMVPVVVMYLRLSLPPWLSCPRLLHYWMAGLPAVCVPSSRLTRRCAPYAIPPAPLDLRPPLHLLMRLQWRTITPRRMTMSVWCALPRRLLMLCYPVGTSVSVRTALA